MHRIVVFTFFVILGLIVGCSSNKGSNVAKNSPVLDVGSNAAPIPSAEPTIASAPINDNPPVAFAAPVPSSTVAPTQQVAFTTPTPAASKTAGKTYTVKKGDTLFSIAKSQLGSGREWQKIAAANPGLTPQKLKAGQQIAMP